MHCSKCGFKLKDSANFCSECGNQNIDISSIYTEKISTSDLYSVSNEINNKQTNKLIIGFLIVIVLLSVGFGSYYIMLSRLSANNSRKSVWISLKNNILYKNSITAIKKSNINI